MTLRDLEGLGSTDVCSILQISAANQRVLPPQAGGAAIARGGGVVQSAVGKCLGHQFAGAAHRVLP